MQMRPTCCVERNLSVVSSGLDLGVEGMSACVCVLLAQ